MTHKQSTLFPSEKPKRTKLTDSQSRIKKEQIIAHRTWKLLKSNKYLLSNFSEEEKRLLKKYYGISI